MFTKRGKTNYEIYDDEDENKDKKKKSGSSFNKRNFITMRTCIDIVYLFFFIFLFYVIFSKPDIIHEKIPEKRIEKISTQSDIEYSKINFILNMSMKVEETDIYIKFVFPKSDLSILKSKINHFYVCCRASNEKGEKTICSIDEGVFCFINKRINIILNKPVDRIFYKTNFVCEFYWV